jgi:hypothetical protein
MSTPTQGDLADFAGFLKNSTNDQVINIHAKEKAAGWLAYADLSRVEAIRRGIEDRLT